MVFVSYLLLKFTVQFSVPLRLQVPASKCVLKVGEMKKNVINLLKMMT